MAPAEPNVSPPSWGFRRFRVPDLCVRVTVPVGRRTDVLYNTLRSRMRGVRHARTTRLVEE